MHSHSAQSSPAENRIFLSIASFCDPMLGFTLNSALEQAAHPERIFVGLVEQQFPELCLPAQPAWGERLRLTQIHPLQARGPCWARAQAMTLYQGERWFLQIDSHTLFEPGWDEQLVRWGHACQSINPRCLITAYPNPFTLQEGKPVAQVVSEQVLAHVVLGGTGFAPDHPVLFFEAVPVFSEQPVYGLHIAAGCLFAPGEIVSALPYDPFLYFHGEEQSLALRAWTHGWDILHIPAVPLYHLYVGPEGSGRPMHWSPELDAQRLTRSQALSEAANSRLRALLWEGADLGVYGLGQARSLQDYAQFSGIDYPGRQLWPEAFKARFGY